MFPILLFLILFQIKHWLADYPLQTEYMLGKFKETNWIQPLAFHALVHAVGTMMLAGLWGSRHVVTLGFIDFIVHFAMDRIKASPTLLGRYKALAASEFGPLKAQAEYAGLMIDDHYKAAEARRKLQGNAYFWWALGLDQMVHHLTHYAVLALLVAGV